MYVSSLISVIIPVYNNDKYIARCLDSLLKQTNQNFEALVINDGSQDRSGEIIREYADRDMRIHYFEQENQGVSVARNKGLDNATGDYVLFLDGDDWLDSDVLERLVATMERDNLDCVSYRFRHVYEDGTQKAEERCGEDVSYQLSSPKEIALFLNTVGRSVFYTSQQHLLKRSIIEGNNLQFARGIKRGEDVLFAHMYAMYIKKGVILDTLTGYNYYHHSKSCIAMKSNGWRDVVLENIKSLVYFRKYLVEYNNRAGGYIHADLAWESLLHIAQIEKKEPSKHMMSRFLRLRCFWRDVISSILVNGSCKRKIMTILYILSRKLFRFIIKI